MTVKPRTTVKYNPEKDPVVRIAESQYRVNESIVNSFAVLVQRVIWLERRVSELEAARAT